MRQLRILLADDHLVVRRGLRNVLEARSDWIVVAEASNGRDAVMRAEELKPDVAILDVAMPLLNGIDATREIVMRSPATRVLVLTMHSDQPYVNQVLEAGAMGYLVKDSADVNLVEAVGAVSEGRSFFGPTTVPSRIKDES